MYNVENHIEPKTVCLIDKVLELVWGPVATGCGKEAGHMITKTAVVGMLHDCHQFNTVVAEVFDAREQVISKVDVTGHLSFWRRDPNVTLVDSKALRPWWSFVSPLVTSVFWVPMSGLVIHTHFFYLDSILCPGGHSPELLPIPGCDEKLDYAVVRNRGLPLGESGNCQAEFPEIIPGADMARFVPFVEIANNCHCLRIGNPLTHLHAVTDKGMFMCLQYAYL